MFDNLIPTFRSRKSASIAKQSQFHRGAERAAPGSVTLIGRDLDRTDPEEEPDVVCRTRRSAERIQRAKRMFEILTVIKEDL